MKRTAVLFAIALMVLITGSAWADNGSGKAQDKAQGSGHRIGGFVDENGDGFNDRAPDADGDGIPNGVDPDYQRPRDGSGRGQGNGNGDGICPNDKSGNGKGAGFGNRAGQGNGTCPFGRTGDGPGTCPQPGGRQSGPGTCDGTGPHGPTGRVRR
jgi:hypothetical protein